MSMLTNALDLLAVRGAEAAAKREAEEQAARAAARAAAREAPKSPAIIKRTSGAAKRAPSAASKADLAVRYPLVGDPVLAVDKRTGKQFLGKGSSPEAKAAAKDLKVITADMRDNGYTPYFDPEQRFYADPSNYPLEGNTLGITPAKEATIAKYDALARDPAALDRLLSAFDLGSQHPGASRWYATGQLEKAYTDALGPEAGREAYKRQFADAMAATTGGMDPAANFRLAHYMNFIDRAGEDTPLAPHAVPYPIGGGKYGVTPNMAQYDKIIRQGGGLSIANPKRFNFSANFLGDIDRATLDEQMMSAWDPKLQMPPSNTYGVYEKALHDLAVRKGVAPAEAQDVMWAGIKLPKEASYTPRPMIDIVNDAIERTSRMTGLDPDEVVEGIVKANRPSYAAGGRVEASDYDYDYDYDYDGARRAGVKPDARGHLPDTYKLPNHITFSDESVYSTPQTPGGRWVDSGRANPANSREHTWGYWPSDFVVKQHPAQELAAYFAAEEPGNFFVLPSGYSLPPSSR